MKHTCSVAGCEGKTRGWRGYCGMHYQRFMKWGDPLKTLVRYGNEIKMYQQVGWGPGTRRAHIVIAERALGKPLPKGAIVHHLDGTKSNRRGNLAILQDQAHHLVIHARMRAKAACGNPDWRKCQHCKKYDDPSNLKFRKVDGMAFHVDCYNRYQVVMRKRRRESRQSGISS